MKKNIIFLLAIVLSVTISYLKAQKNILFFEEHIDFSLDSNYFCVNGIYSFQNKSDQEKNQQIMFPFADKSTGIDSIRIINLYSGRKIDFNRKGNFIYFAVYLPINDTVDVNIFYRQKTSENNKYVLTSTKSWGEPLKTAIYTLSIERYIKIKSLSYLPDSIKEFDNRIVYIWEKHDFMPEYDFEIILDE
ncbi:MAG: hypothetical protein FWC41_13210 [Firmicutes bacterium]|nr:hypothetical protein [Bacillota bacterium]